MSLNFAASAQILQWADKFENKGTNNIQDLKTDKKGGIYSIITTTDYLDLSINQPPYWVSPSGSADNLIVKHDSAGLLQYVLKNQGTRNTAYISEIAASDQGALFAVGFFRESTDFDPDTGKLILNPSSINNPDYYLQAFDSKGKLDWIKTYNFNGTSGLSLRSIDADNLGNVYISGYFAGTMNFDPSTPGMSFTSKGYFDAVVLKYSKQGNLIWVRSFGGTGLDQIIKKD